MTRHFDRSPLPAPDPDPGSAGGVEKSFRQRGEAANRFLGSPSS